jgi:CBS domain containing-hemolysin-like protein
MSDTAALVVSLVLVLLNAWFVLFEFALVRMRSSKLEELEDRGVRNAAVARKMHERMNDYLSACQVGITIASLAIGWLAEPAFASLLEPVFGSISHGLSVGVAFALITILHIVIGEQVPKAAAIQAPERALLLSVTPMRVVAAIFYVPLKLLNGIVNVTLRLLGLSVNLHEESSLSVEEIRIVVSDAYRQGEVSLDRSLLLENALDFPELTAGSVMVPIVRAVSLDVRSSWAETLAVIAEKRMSRYLLADGEAIVGYVHIKDLALRDGEVALASVRRELLRLPAATTLDIVMRRMQRERTQIAMVTGAGDVPIGIVTLEDVLEELVGEIHDEFEEVRLWSLADHVDAGAVQVDVEHKTRDEAIRSMVQCIAKASPEIRADAAMAAVLRRESQGSTAVGHEVAVPHARLPGLVATHVAIARLVRPISWRRTGEPVRFLFLILTPAETPLEQNRALMRIAQLVRDELLFARLDEAPTPDALVEVVRALDVVS